MTKREGRQLHLRASCFVIRASFVLRPKGAPSALQLGVEGVLARLDRERQPGGIGTVVTGRNLRPLFRAPTDGPSQVAAALLGGRWRFTRDDGDLRRPAGYRRGAALTVN